MNKRRFVVLVVVTLCVSLFAQEKTIILTEQGLPYQQQSYFYCGSGSTLDEAKIKENWDNGKRITSAAYTKNGWFIVMALKTGISAQTYKYSSSWPSEWIKTKWDEGFNITSIAGSSSNWLVVMSKGSGITNQSWSKRGTKAEIVEQIKSFRAKGIPIIDICYNGNYWVAIFGKTSKIISQNYFWVSESDLTKKIPQLVWNKNHAIQLLQYANGEYLVVHCNYRKNHNRMQNYISNPGDIKKYMTNRWNDNYSIAYVGGGYNATSYSSASTTSPSRQVTTTSNPTKNSKTQVSSLTYKTWETKWDKGRTEFVRSADGMVEETMYMNCVCLNGICKICAGLGVTGYGMFQTYCSYCGGTAKCHFCGGTGTKVTTQRYRYIDEYYSNGGSALHVTSSSLGASVYLGGVGSLYGGYGNSRPIRDEGSYYSFGGETLYGVKTNSYRLSKDYRTLWSDNQEYHIIDKAEYDRISEITSKLKNGTYTVPNTGTSGTYSTGRSSSNSRSKSSSVYIKCSTCGGSTICTGCNGKKGSWQDTGYYTGSGSQSWINCGSCGGTGKCRICYGTGRL